ncbi:MAG TPA: hypothetical protein PLJ21_08010, partial [Pseudobdellovibrionaceae bacterium]|nr:hypothetical protein [Pseudobdellovibrionaceae bacterium]
MKMLNALVLSSFFLLLACSNNQSSFESNSDHSLQASSTLQNPFKITYDGPEAIGLSGAAVKINVDIPENLKNISATLDGNDLGRISYLPFQFYINPNEFKKEQIELKIYGYSISNDFITLTKLIKLTPISEDSTGSGPCLLDKGYDACIFRKNPVYQNKGPVLSGISFGKDLEKQQSFGVKINNLSQTNSLTNSNVNIKITNGTKATKNAEGNWKFNYKDDSTDHKVGQVMAYYWLNEQINMMKNESGIFYAENKNIQVDAYKASVKNNAYWSNNNIVMGSWTNSSGTQEMALSAEVYLHELGHGNLDHAMGTDVAINKYCNTDQGCIGAIHEGQADIHAALIFPDDPTMGQSLSNTLAGWKDRDVRTNINSPVSDFFKYSSGEIHGMGSAYASILWKIYTDPQMNRADFMKLFS